MKDANILNKEIIAHWQQLRQMTYDLLEAVSQEDISKKLPFEKSQTLGNQFYCIIGTTETFGEYIKTGVWTEWECSLEEAHTPNKQEILRKLQESDQKMCKILENVDLLSNKNGQKTPLQRYLILTEHEAHHQGQMINFIYALDLPIPQSWCEKWNLKK